MKAVFEATKWNSPWNKNV